MDILITNKLLMIELLVTLIASVPITIGTFDFCEDGKRGEHHLIIKNDEIIENSIKVCEDDEDIVFIIVHELGHQFWSLYLSVIEREQYKALQTDYIGDYTREYAMSEPIEDFADIFAYIILGRSPQGNITQSYTKKKEFIENIISRY